MSQDADIYTVCIVLFTVCLINAAEPYLSIYLDKYATVYVSKNTIKRQQWASANISKNMNWLCIQSNCKLPLFRLASGLCVITPNSPREKAFLILNQSAISSEQREQDTWKHLNKFIVGIHSLCSVAGCHKANKLVCERRGSKDSSPSRCPHAAWLGSFSKEWPWASQLPDCFLF